VSKFIRSCSENYTKYCYILKLDISVYFIIMNKDILCDKIKSILIPVLKKDQSTMIIKLIQKIIFNQPIKNSIFKWKKSDYIWLPKNKSLFFARKNFWLPIWNLTSQLFSNIYLSDFDKYIKNELHCKYYGRYVDDFVIVHTDKNYLTSLIPQISHYLQSNLWLTLHPNKIYLQHYYKGVLFLWAFITPHRNYIRKRTIGNFYDKIIQLNNEIKLNPEVFKTPEFKNKFLSIINSYLWFLKHYKSYKIRKKLLLQKINSSFWNEFYISGGCRKVVKKRK
jgi:hypothetical protein